ncbi:MAG: hypothetical protein JXM79_03675 [Sedimentisphaerales bacterium]|nr:hypothetical protein [Sedimentisphaerales bacterium]
MKLQEFISETLKEYITGVKDAQEFASEQGAAVNPSSKKAGELKSYRMVDAHTGQLLRDVEFDVAVTYSEESETKKGAGIVVAAIGMGAQTKAETTSSSISRIKFTVPVALPIQDRR